jgi:PAS domain S-box-containing protein
MTLSMERNMVFKKLPRLYPAARLVCMSILVVLALAVLGLWLYQNHKDRLLRHAGEVLSSLADSKVQQLAAWRAERMAEGLAIMHSPFLSEAAAALVKEPDNQRLRAQIERWMQNQVKDRGCRAAYLLDLDQKLVLEVPAGSGVITDQAAFAVQQALRTGRPCLSELHLALSGGGSELDLAAPIYRDNAAESLPAAALVLKTDPALFLYPMIQPWPSPSFNVETSLVTREGEYVLYLNELRHRPGTALSLRLPADRLDLPAAKAVRGEQRTVFGVDYRGVEVLAALRAVPDSPWFLVAKADLSEIYAPLCRDWDLMLVLAVAVLALLAFGAALNQRSRKLRLLLSLLNLEKEKSALLANFEASEMKLSIIMDGIGDGVIATDADGKVILMNAAAERLCRCSRADARGREIEEVLPLFRETTKEELENPLRKALRTGRAAAMLTDTMLAVSGAAPLAVADTASAIVNKEGQPSCAVMVFRDVTLERKTQMELQRTARLESLGVLAGGVAHDFNNMLAAIGGGAGLARAALEDGKQEEVDRHLERIENAAMLAGGLTQQLLTFAKGSPPITRLLRLDEVVRRAAALSMSGSANTCSLEISQVDPVMGDEGQLTQVIHNLILNANQAMPSKGTIVISMNMVNGGAVEGSAVPKGRYLRTSVSDSGVGIPADVLPRIFDPFFTTKKTGKGLGLSSAFSIIRAHGGFLRVESVVGQGSVFSFYLPASEGAAAAEAGPRAESKEQLRQMRILIMDDEPSVREVLAEIGRHLGHEVTAVADGPSALLTFKQAIVEKRQFDLAILDLTIPGGMGGKEVLQELLKLDSGLRAIATSGYATESVMENYADYGFNGVLPKPYRLAEVEALISKLAQRLLSPGV